MVGAAYNSADLAPALAALSGPGSPGAPLGAAGPLIRFTEATPFEMKVDYSGRLSEFLDLVATHFNQSWQHKNGRIVFSKLITRTFELPALPGAQEAIEESKAGGNGGGLMGMMGSMGGGVMALGGQLMGVGVSMGQMQPLGKELFAYGREKAGEDVMGPIVGSIPGLSQFV